MVYENEDGSIHKCTECQDSCYFCESLFCEYDRDALFLKKQGLSFAICPDCAAKHDVSNILLQITKEIGA